MPLSRLLSCFSNSSEKHIDKTKKDTYSEKTETNIHSVHALKRINYEKEKEDKVYKVDHKIDAIKADPQTE